MWHIVAIGYLFVAVMYSAAQPGLARVLIYLMFWAVLPAAFTVSVISIRHRNRLMKAQEQTEIQAAHQARSAKDADGGGA